MTWALKSNDNSVNCPFDGNSPLHNCTHNTTHSVYLTADDIPHDDPTALRLPSIERLEFPLLKQASPSTASPWLTTNMMYVMALSQALGLVSGSLTDGAPPPSQQFLFKGIASVADSRRARIVTSPSGSTLTPPPTSCFNRRFRCRKVEPSQSVHA